jgi:hypothetical protein
VHYLGVKEPSVLYCYWLGRTSQRSINLRSPFIKVLPSNLYLIVGLPKDPQFTSDDFLLLEAPWIVRTYTSMGFNSKYP